MLTDLLPFTNLVSDLPSGKALNIEAIEAIEQSARTFADELTTVADDLKGDHDRQVETSYCIDFDVLHAAMGRLDVKTPSKAWSTIAISQADKKLLLLPGSLYELVQFARRSIKEFEKIENSTLTQAFYRAVEGDASPRLMKTHSYLRTLSNVRAQEIRNKLYFIINVLSKNHVKTRTNFPEFDISVFNDIAATIAVGNRKERIINNRIDALNLSLIRALNDESYKSSRYVLVTNSSAMLHLSSTIDDFCESTHSNSLPLANRQYLARNRGQVIWTPKRAVLYQLFYKAGGNGSLGSRLAWNCIHHINQLLSFLASSKSHDRSDMLTADQLLSKNIFTNLIGSLQSVQSLTDNWKSDHFLAEGGVERQAFSAEDPKGLFDYIDGQISRNLTEFGRSHIIDDNIRRSKEPMVLTVFNDVSEFGLSEAVEISTTRGKPVVNIGKSDKYTTIWTRSSATITEFCGIVVTVNNYLRRRFVMGQFSELLREKHSDDPDNWLDMRVKYFSGGEWHEESLSHRKFTDFSKISRRIMEISGDRTIAILRFDSELYSASFEIDNLKVIRYGRNIPELGQIFISHTVATEFRTADLQGMAKVACENQRLLPA